MQQRNGHYFYSRYATGIRFIKELRENEQRTGFFFAKELRQSGKIKYLSLVEDPYADTFYETFLFKYLNLFIVLILS